VFRDAFVVLQKIGKSLMIPVAVLPVAGLLLGIGAAHFEWIPPLVSALMKASGDVVFGNLPLISRSASRLASPRMRRRRDFGGGRLCGCCWRFSALWPVSGASSP